MMGSMQVPLFAFRYEVTICCLLLLEENNQASTSWGQKKLQCYLIFLPYPSLTFDNLHKRYKSNFYLIFIVSEAPVDYTLIVALSPTIPGVTFSNMCPSPGSTLDQCVQPYHQINIPRDSSENLLRAQPEILNQEFHDN